MVETGAESGVLVIDVDVKGGTDGYTQLEDLERDLGELPETLSVRTSSGGAHFYFRHPGGDRINGKLASAIDLKGDKEREDGFVYVVGPNSPGYVKTVDPHVVTPADPYEVVVDVPIAELPELWVGFMRAISSESKVKGFAPTPIDVNTDEGRRRIVLGVEACLKMPPSIQGQDGSRALWSVALKLVRKLELPIDTARDLILRHFNPLCVPPWSEQEVDHKLEDARDRSDIPCGMLSEATIEGIRKVGERVTNPHRTPVFEAKEKKDYVGADRSYDGERMKLTKAAVVQTLYKSPDWDGVLWFDALSQKPRATDPPILGGLTLERGELSAGDLAKISHWFDVKGFLVSEEMVRSALWIVSTQPDRKRNLIAEYLDGLPKATEAKILPTLATDILGCKDAFDNVLVMKTLVAAARRAREPGAFHKAMLVLKGEQQCGKTPCVKILAGGWYQTTGNGNLADRDTILECQGKWLVEVEELSALNKADADALKTAISRTHDPITKKYEPDARSFPRSFTLIGTTNKDEFLTDATGNARYWVVEVGQIDLAKLEQLRDVIWAEADFLARSGMSNELEVADRGSLEERNTGYLNTHPWLNDVAAYLHGKTEVSSASEVLEFILKGDLSKATQREKNAVADLMRTLGCVSLRTKRNGKTVRFWRVPEGVDAPPAKVTPLRPIKGGVR